MAPNDTRAFKVGDRVRLRESYGESVGISPSETFVVEFREGFHHGMCIVDCDGEDRGVYDFKFEHVDPEPADAVGAPSHYARFPIQPATFIAANELPFLAGNAVKYTVRAPHKGREIEDYRKAIRCLEMLIEAAVRREAVAAGADAATTWGKPL